MSFSVNDPFLYLLSAIIVVFVVAQSVFFLVKANRRAQQMGCGAPLPPHRHATGSQKQGAATTAPNNETERAIPRSLPRGAPGAIRTRGLPLR